LAMVASEVIGPSQSAFIPGRYILDGFVILHETLHELKRKKMDGVILKIDFEKAYDKVNWHFYNRLCVWRDFHKNGTGGLNKLCLKGVWVLR
jgi:hypothetical protein